MKKLLLSLCSVLAAFFAVSAETVEFDFVTDTYGYNRESGQSSNYLSNGTTINSGDATIVLNNRATGNANWRFWSDGLRATKAVEGEMIISVAKATITGIKVDIKNNATKISANDANAVSVSKNNSFSWTGSSEEVTLLFTQAATTAVSKVVITYEPAGDPDKLTPSLKWSESAVEVIEGQEFTAPTLSMTVDGEDMTEDIPDYVLFSSSDEEVATIDADGKITLGNKPGKATITATVNTEDGVFNEGSASYTITVIPSVASLAEFEKAAPNKDDKAYMNCELTVVSYKELYCYVIDSKENPGLIYKSGLPYQVGDVIPAGWYGKASPYNGLYEIVPVGDMPTSTTTAEVTYTTVKTISDADINKVLLINGVKLANEMPSTASNMNVTLLGDETIQLRNAMEIASQAAGLYDILAAVATFNNTLQIYPIEFREYTDDRQPVTLTWSAESVEAIEGDSEIAVAFTATPAEIAESITFDSSDETIATYDKNTGKIVLTGKIGTTTITANFPGNDEYAPAFAAITVAVKEDTHGYIAVNIQLTDVNSTYGVYTIDGWKAENSNIQKYTINDIDKIAFNLNGKTSTIGKLTSPGLVGGIVGLKFAYGYFASTGDKAVKFKVIIKHAESGYIAYEKTITDDLTNKNKTLVNVAIEAPELSYLCEDEYVIEFVNLCPSNKTSNADRIGLFDIAYKLADVTYPAPEHSELHINQGAYADDDFEHLTDASYSGNGNWVHVKFAPTDSHSVYFRFKNSQGEVINPEPADYRPKSDDKANVKARAAETTKDLEGFTLYTEPFKLTQTGTLEHYTVNNETGVRNAATQIALSDVTGIEDITIDAAAGEAEYFNLQGVRVANPENGIFIVRHGNKISKQIIR